MVFFSLGKEGKACGQKMVVESSSGEEGRVARLQVSVEVTIN